MGDVTERVIAELKSGATIPAIAARVGVSEVFVKVLLDHLSRLKLVDSAQALCASGLGGCGPQGAVTDQAKLHCAGCPLTVKVK